MKAGLSNIEINSIIAIAYIKDENENCLNGFIGKATHPFAIGCTDNGWIGIITNSYTPFGYKVNCHEKEVKVLNDEEIDEYNKYIAIYGANNVYFDVNAKKNRDIMKDNRPYTKPTGIVLCPKFKVD